MKKITLFLILIFSFLLFNSSYSQPAIQWQESFGGTANEWANCVRQTSDGGYVVAGWSYSFDGDVTGWHGTNDFWIIKLDALGALQWQKALGGSVGEEASSIQQTADGGFIVTGIARSYDGDVTGQHGGGDFWLVKLDSAGTIQWQKCFGGSTLDFGYSVHQTTDGGYILSGYTLSNNGDVTGNHGNYDTWVVKVNSSGNLQWQKCLGGTGDESSRMIQQTLDGGYAVLSSSTSNDSDVTGNHGGYDYWFAKLDTSGTIQWQKSFGGTLDDFANSFQQTTDGGYILAGNSLSNNGDVTGHHGGHDYWIVKIDDAGTIQWQKSLGGPSDDYALSVQQTAEGGYVVSGGSESSSGNVTGHHGLAYGDYWIVKLNAFGAIQWQQCYGGTVNDFGISIRQTTDGGFIVAGYSNSLNGDVTGNIGGEDYWIVKLESFVGVNDNNFVEDIFLTPNPASNELVVRCQESGSIEIYDVFGKKVFPSPLAPLSWRRGDERGEVINVSSFLTGIYFVKVKTDAGISTGKFIKQ